MRHYGAVLVAEFDMREHEPIATYGNRPDREALHPDVEPGIEGRFHGQPILAGGKALDELTQRSARNDPHRSQGNMVPLWEQVHR